MITGSINLSQLDKSKFIKGKKGTYVDIVLIETPNSEYGDFMIKQGLSKEDRANNPRGGAILGNAKNRGSKAPRTTRGADEDNGNGGDDYDF